MQPKRLHPTEHHPIRLGALLTLLPALTGCFSLQKELIRESALRSEQWRALTARPLPSKTLNITWPEALKLLRSQNPKVRAADLDLLRSQEQRRQVSRSLIPMLQLQAGYHRLLTNGPRMDPFSFATDVLVDIPGMVSYTMRRESAELLVVRCELMREAVWREQVTDLYKAFHKAAALSLRERELSESLHELPDNLPGALRETLEQQRLQLTKSQEEWSEKIGTILGIPGTPLSASFESFPDAGYEQVQNRPKPEALARLPLQLAAVELVAMRAREMGAKLEDLPQVSVSISTPRLYQHTSGESVLWSSRDFAAGTNVLWTVDTRAQRAGRRRVLGAEHTLRKEALEQEATRLNNRIQKALKALRKSDEQLHQLEEALGANPNNTLTASLRARKRELQEERRDWQVALWFLDDSRWPIIPPL